MNDVFGEFEQIKARKFHHLLKKKLYLKHILFASFNA